MAKRYVARVVVESIETPDAPDLSSTGRRIEPAAPAERRVKATIANIVVGSTDLERLVTQAHAHLALVEDAGDVEVSR